MATTRERREAKAERLREWAAKREQSGTAALEQGRQMYDAIPFGQPILVGHHSEGRDRRYRDRAWNTLGRGVEDHRKAASMASRADNIEAAADRAIYDDDPDVVERLTERIAELEAERDRWKAYNRSARKDEANLDLLDERQQAALEGALKYHPRNVAAGGTVPSYTLSNLSGNIRRYKERLKRIQRGDHLRRQERPNKYRGDCETCGATVEPYQGVIVREGGGDWQVFCVEHKDGGS
jgi:hypothetical protein